MEGEREAHQDQFAFCYPPAAAVHAPLRSDPQRSSTDAASMTARAHGVAQGSAAYALTRGSHQQQQQQRGSHRHGICKISYLGTDAQTPSPIAKAGIITRRMADDSSDVEHTLATLPLAHVYKLPPRTSAGGWHCQDWPKENHIFSGRVLITALREQCTIKLMDKDNGSLFAQCPLDNDNPQLSVEPVTDSSRYFVLRVSDGSGRYAYLGMGFIERSDAFEFNVTLQVSATLRPRSATTAPSTGRKAMREREREQTIIYTHARKSTHRSHSYSATLLGPTPSQDHVKRLKNEREAEALAAAPAPPSQDFTLKSNIAIAVPGRAGNALARQRPAPPPGGAAPGGVGGLGAFLPPPPGGNAAQPQRGRRIVAGGATTTAAAATTTAAAATTADPFATSGSALFASSADPFLAAGTSPFGATSVADPFAAATTATTAAADDPFASFDATFGGPAATSSNPFAAAPKADDNPLFDLSTPFSAVSFDPPPAAAADDKGGAGGKGGGGSGWVAFG